MITAALLAASVLAPAGTAPIQGTPVCLPVTAQAGHSYQLSIYDPARAALTVTPAHDGLERRLHQVPPSWVSFGSGSQVPVTLSVPSGAAPGAYWSDIRAGVPGGPGNVSLGTAATAAFVFTVGPSPAPPPPCGALTLAYSTGIFPAWPSGKYATSGWKQVGEQDARYNPKPVTSPTATAADSAAPAVPAAARSPAAAARHPAPWTGWAVVIIAVAGILRWFGRLLKGRKLCPLTGTAGSSSPCSCLPSRRRCCWPPGAGGDVDCRRSCGAVHAGSLHVE